MATPASEVSAMSLCSSSNTVRLKVKEQLDAYSDWTIYQFIGNSVEELLEKVPQLKLPAAVIALFGQTFENEPRRTIDLHVIVAVQCADTILGADDTDPRATLAEKVVELLDRQTPDETALYFRIDGIEDFDLADYVLASDVKFSSMDHV